MSAYRSNCSKMPHSQRLWGINLLIFVPGNKLLHKLYLSHSLLRGRAAVTLTLAHAGIKADCLVNIFLKKLRVFFKLCKAQLLKGAVSIGAEEHQLACDLIGISEGHTLAGEVICAVSGVYKALLCGSCHIGRANTHGIHHGAEDGQAHFENVEVSRTRHQIKLKFKRMK